MDAISQAIFGASGALMLLLDRQGRVERFNPACEKLTGWSEGEILGQPFWDRLIPSEQHQRLRTVFGQLVAGLFPNQMENEWVLRNGRRVWISFSNTAILDADGKVTHIVSIGIETTQRREAERLMMESEERLRILVDHAPDAIVVVDAERQCFLSGNPNAARLFGVKRQDLAGALIMRFSPARQPDGRTSQEAATEYIERALAGTSPTFEWMHLTAAGQPVPCEVRLVRLPGDGTPLLRGSVIDITERKRAQATRLAAERGAVIGRFASVMAHEVNNPLQVIKAYIEPLTRRANGLPQVVEGLAIIDQQVDRIARQVGALQDFVRPGVLHKHSAHIGKALRVVITLFEPRFSKLGKHLTAFIPDDLPSGVVDAAALQQVLVTLLENALDAIPAKGRVTVAAEVEDHALLLVVSDDGPGLGADPERLFADFITTKPDGTGLGLPTARRICRDHGGWLDGANRSGGGAVFTARLRLDDPQRDITTTP
jgi:PAS domain S-box-containing protein